MLFRSVKFRGVNWADDNPDGKHVTNTCPNDNQLTGMVLHYSKNKKLLDYFPDDEPHAILKEAIVDCYEGRSWCAQRAIYNICREKNEAFKKSTQYVTALKANKEIEAKNRAELMKSSRSKAPANLKKLRNLPELPFHAMSKDNLWEDSNQIFFNETLYLSYTMYILHINNLLIKSSNVSQLPR